MRMMMTVTIPHQKFNAAVKDGTATAKMGKILDAIKPEAAYFTDHHGHRCAFLIVELSDTSKMPALADPWFLTFEADVQLHACMVPDDLKRAGLEAIGKQWG